MNNKNIIQMPDGYLNKTPLFQFILLSCLFPLWGCAAALNDILITQFKSVFSLSNFASALVQSAFYGGYFLIAIPASLVIKKTSYKVAILTGLTLYCRLYALFPGVAHGNLHHVPRRHLCHRHWPKLLRRQRIPTAR
jgi:FHS family L-fucose permease-like MFS transporter